LKREKKHKTTTGRMSKRDIASAKVAVLSRRDN